MLWTATTAKSGGGTCAGLTHWGQVWFQLLESGVRAERVFGEIGAML